MKRIIYTAFLLMAGFALMNNSGGRASSANQGNTGAPGDNSRTCANCHGRSIPVELSIEVYDTDDQLVSSYKPGETYRVVVSLDSDSPSARAYGFQMTSIIDNNLEDVPTWANPSVNARIANARDRQYVEHNGPSPESSFEVEWTAPQEDQGNITFYAAGNAVNQNGSTGGDGSDESQLTLSPDMTSNSVTVQDLSVFRSSANPVTGKVEYTVPQATYEVRIHDVTGNLVYRSEQSGKLLHWNAEDMSKGTNYVQVVSENGIFTDQLIVQ